MSKLEVCVFCFIILFKEMFVFFFGDSGALNWQHRACLPGTDGRRQGTSAPGACRRPWTCFGAGSWKSSQFWMSLTLKS